MLQSLRDWFLMLNCRISETYNRIEAVPPNKGCSPGMGMSRLQRLTKIEMPLSLPLIFSGVKIALVNALSIAVMGVLIGAGGLGYPIYRGIQTNSLGAILSGAIPVVLMAMMLDYFITKMEKRALRKGGAG